jgi:hypothetical protein
VKALPVQYCNKQSNRHMRPRTPTKIATPASSSVCESPEAVKTHKRLLFVAVIELE